MERVNNSLLKSLVLRKSVPKGSEINANMYILKSFFF